MRIRPAYLNSAEGNVSSQAVVGMFKDAVFQLTTSPSSVPEYLKPIVDTLKGGVNDPEVINEIIEVLLEQVCINRKVYLLQKNVKVVQRRLRLDCLFEESGLSFGDISEVLGPWQSREEPA